MEDLAGMLGSVIKKVTGKDITLTPELAQQIAGIVSASLPLAEQSKSAEAAKEEPQAQDGHGKKK